LVTGGAGFIGLHLASKLAAQGNHVVLCDNFFRRKRDKELDELLTNDDIELVNADLTSKSAVNEQLPNDIDLVFHLAAINGTRYVYEIPCDVIRVNTLSLMNILEWIRESECKRMVWTSSSEVHSGTVELSIGKIPTPEETPLCIIDPKNPRNSYAGSKLLGEILCSNYRKQFGLDITIARPYNIYGPRMGFEHVIPEFILRVLRREDPFNIKGGENTRAFCYVDDAVAALMGIVEEPKTVGETINIGNDTEEISMIDLAKKIFDMMNVHPKVLVQPAPEGSVSRRCPQLTKIKRLTGYRPKVSLDEGLHKTRVWYESWLKSNS
jgi:UDP-glucose 4-epimerase